MPQINVRVEEAKHQRLLREAQQQGVSVSELIRRSLKLREERRDELMARVAGLEDALENVESRLSRIEELANR